MVMWPLQRYRLSKFIDQLGLIAYYEDEEAMIRPSQNGIIIIENMALTAWDRWACCGPRAP